MKLAHILRCRPHQIGPLLFSFFTLLAVLSPPKLKADEGVFDGLDIGGGNFTIDGSGNAQFNGNLYGTYFFGEGGVGLTLQSDSYEGLSINANDDGSSAGVIRINSYGSDSDSDPTAIIVNANGSGANAGAINLNASGTGASIGLLSTGSISLGANNAVSILSTGTMSIESTGWLSLTTGTFTISAENIHISGTSLSSGILALNSSGQLINAPHTVIDISSGNLGLGTTTSPLYTLDVGGNGRVSGIMYMGSLNSSGSSSISGTLTVSSLITSGSATLSNALTVSGSTSVQSLSSTIASINAGTGPAGNDLVPLSISGSADTSYWYGDEDSGSDAGGVVGLIQNSSSGGSAFWRAKNDQGSILDIGIAGSGVNGWSGGYFYMPYTAPNGSGLIRYSGSGAMVLDVNAYNSYIMFGYRELEWARFSPLNGNMLIGGTTDISGSGGLKVFGTTQATSTISGALQVAGGASEYGNHYTGGNNVTKGSLTVTGSSTIQTLSAANVSISGTLQFVLTTRS